MRRYITVDRVKIDNVTHQMNSGQWSVLLSRVSLVPFGFELRTPQLNSSLILEVKSSSRSNREAKFNQREEQVPQHTMW